MKEETREVLAAVQHEIWSHWMRYMFDQGDLNMAEGTWKMPRDKVDRWQRQMNTDYADLPDKEKEGDREQIPKIMAALIYDAIDRWHGGVCGSISLANFLGMTGDEYGHWVETGEVPDEIDVVIERVEKIK